MSPQAIWQGHKIEVSARLSPRSFFLTMKNSVKVDGKEVIQFSKELSLTDHAVGEFEHQGETARIEAQIKSGLFLPSYLIKINEQVIMQGFLGVETLGLIRIYFSFLGLAYISSLVPLAIPTLRDTLFRIYDPLWFTSFKMIDAIFGILFLYFAISIKSLLLNSLRLITTVLYVRIGLLIAITPSLIVDLVQKAGTSSFDWILAIGLRIAYIWFFGYLLVNCQRFSQELRLREIQN